MPSAEPAVPVLPPSMSLPTLPSSNPSAPPPKAEDVVGGPATPDIHAVRSYQLRAERDRRRRKVVGRAIFFIILLAAAAGAAMFFGRDLLFPTQWDSSLTPLVDQIQTERGAEFSETVPLRVVDDDEYAAVAMSSALGESWADRLPQWRALGIANGGASAQEVTSAIVAWRPAIYDATTDTIYQAESVEPETVDDELRLALLEVFERQRGSTPETSFSDASNGVVGVSSPAAIASHAIDRALLAGSVAVPEIGDEVQTPLPVLYELLAIDTLGVPLLESASVDPPPEFGDTYPPELVQALSQSSSRATIGLLPNQAEPLGEPVALGPEGWRMIWQSRLPAGTVDRLVPLLLTDAYQPVMLGSSSCFFAVLETRNAEDGATLLASMTSWAAAAPTESAAIASQVSPTRVELQACDPGAGVVQTLNAESVTALLRTQLERLG
jgi:hypothetical protein